MRPGRYAESKRKQVTAAGEFAGARGPRLRITARSAFRRLCGAPHNRNGIDGLVGLCRRELKADPFEGCVFVFRNRSRQAIKILVYDGQGFWLHQKRLSSSKFTWWPRAGGGPTEQLEAYELQLLLWNGDPRFARAAGQWRKLRAG